jgi:hypothetical protein
MGSRSHDFDAALLSRAVTSAMVTGVKVLRAGCDLALIAGGSAILVEDRLASTLSLEKAANSSTFSLVDDD